MSTRLTDGSVRFDLGPAKGTRRLDCGCLFTDYQHVSDLAPCGGHAALDVVAAVEKLRNEIRRSAEHVHEGLVRLRPAPELDHYPPLWKRVVRYVAGDDWLRERHRRELFRRLAERSEPTDTRRSTDGR